MAARRKLDKVGVKISLEQWQKLGRGERLAICHLPVETAEERETMHLFIDEAVRARCGVAPKELPEQMRQAAEPPDNPPAELVENARNEGITLDGPVWKRLDPDERYALMKLGGSKHSHNLAAALREFLNP